MFSVCLRVVAQDLHLNDTEDNETTMSLGLMLSRTKGTSVHQLAANLEFHNKLKII